MRIMVLLVKTPRGCGRLTSPACRRSSVGSSRLGTGQYDGKALLGWARQPGGWRATFKGGKMGDERKENEGGRPSVDFVPLFWVGRAANRWCLTDGDTRV